LRRIEVENFEIRDLSELIEAFTAGRPGSGLQARGDPIALQPKRYPNLSKARVHVLLEPWCEQRGLRCPSVSTIGRIIARAPDRMRHVPMRLDARGRPRDLP